MTRRQQLVALVVSVAIAAVPASAAERWVSAIQTTGVWGVFACTDYFVTGECSTDKGFDDPGSLPLTIRVGETVRYTNKKGQPVDFRVRSISYFVYEKDLDSTWDGNRYTAKKGDTSCFLYDVPAPSNTHYTSKIAIRGCRRVQWWK
jgi:hypothetical protein